MPFFRKKRTSSLNVLTTDKEKQANNSEPSQLLHTSANSHSISVPPLNNFIAPPDFLEKNGQIKPRLGQPTIYELSAWAKNYFSAFLRGEGLDEDLIVLWDDLNEYVQKSRQPKEHSQDKSNVINNEQKRTTANNFNNNNNIEDKEGAAEEVDDIDESIEAIQLKSRAQAILLKSITRNLLKPPDDEELGSLSSSISKLQTHLSQVLQNEHLPRYFDSKYHIKCQVDLFTNGDVTLHEILSNQLALFYFMEFVEQEHKREVLEFLLGATNFAEQLKTEIQEDQIDVKIAQSDAMVLYEKYISLQAPCPLGFRDEIRSEVERRICSDEIALCFEQAIAESYIFLHVTCLDSFLKSSLFFSFLSDLINSLGSTSNKTHKRSESTSTCSSSTSLTSPKANPKTSQLNNRQKKTLSLGRVNSLGKYEADTDSFAELFKNESSLAKTMKKFVNFDEKEKAKEDLAWQVAEMIVSEITSITMGSDGSSPNLNQ